MQYAPMHEQAKSVSVKSWEEKIQYFNLILVVFYDSILNCWIAHEFNGNKIN